MKKTLHTLLGGALWLLATSGITHDTAAQEERLVLHAAVTDAFRNGRDVTYETYYQILSMNGDGTEAKQLTTGNESSFYPRWSPSRSHILFYKEDGLHIMDSDGGEMFKVADEYRYGADWGSNERMICYAGQDLTAPGPGALYVVSVDPNAKGKTKKVGTPEILLEDGNFWFPAWSPKENRIAYSNFGHIAVLDLTTGEETSLDLMRGMFPSWDPTGEKIAFSSNSTPDGINQIFIMNADFSNIRQLTSLTQSASRPAFSDDGTRLAFRVGSDVDGWENFSVYTLTLATGELELLWDQADHPDWNP